MTRIPGRPMMYGRFNGRQDRRSKVSSGFSETHFPFMKNSANVRDYGRVVNHIFDVRDTISTCHEITYPGFEFGSFDKSEDFAVVFLKPTTHVNGNFTQSNVSSIIQRVGKAGWYARAIRIFRGQALPPAVVIDNYPNPFYGKGTYEKCDDLVERENSKTLRDFLVPIYGESIYGLRVLHSFDLLRNCNMENAPANEKKERYGRFPIEFVTSLWKRGYGEDKYEKEVPGGINRIPDKYAKNQKTRIFLVTEANIKQTLKEMHWSDSTKKEVERDLEELGMSKGFVMSNGFACELLEALGRQDEFIPVFLFQRGPEGVTQSELRERIIGVTNPVKALPGSIRGDAYGWYGGNRGISDPIIVPDMVVLANNICHCSEDKRDAIKEAGLWFGRSLFETLLMGSAYPPEQIADMIENPVIGREASNVNVHDYLLTRGVHAFTSKFVPIPDFGRKSSTIMYSHWMGLRDRYKDDDINMGKHQLDPAHYTTPSREAIPALAASSKPATENVRYLVGMAGQNYRYYRLNEPESSRAKALDPITATGRGVEFSPIELKLNEIISLIKKHVSIIPILQIISNNYNNEFVRSQIGKYLARLNDGTVNKLFDLYYPANDAAKESAAGLQTINEEIQKVEAQEIHIGQEKTEMIKAIRIKAILDRMVSPAGSLPRMVPQGADLQSEPQYRREQFNKWVNNYAPLHYFTPEKLSELLKTPLTDAQYESVVSGLVSAGLASRAPEEQSVGDSEKPSVFHWTEKALRFSPAEFSRDIAASGDEPSRQAIIAHWNMQPKYNGDSHVDAAVKRALQSNYTFDHYLERTVTDSQKGKGSAGDYCFDRTQNVTLKSPGHMDILTHYIINQMRVDLVNNKTVAFASCAEDFAFEITNDLINHVKASSKALTFLINAATVAEGAPHIPAGGFIFSKVDPGTRLNLTPEIYESFQFKKALPTPNTKQVDDPFYWHNLLQVGINLKQLEKFVFGSRSEAFEKGELSEVEIKEILWEKIYSKIDPMVEVRAVDQGNIWAAQLVYLLGQSTSIGGFAEFLRKENEQENFPFVQIKYQQDKTKARQFYESHKERYPDPVPEKG